MLHRHQPPSLRHPFFRLTHKCLRRFLFSPVPSLFPPRYHTCGLVGLVGLGVAAMWSQNGTKKADGHKHVVEVVSPDRNLYIACGDNEEQSQWARRIQETGERKRPATYGYYGYDGYDGTQ